MFYSQPPSWYPDANSRNRVDAARGAVRDALGGLRNLEQLSSSMRVGPRSLSSVLPDVRASCVPLRQGLEELMTAVATHRMDTHLALNSLREYAMPRIDELTEVLERSERQPMQARNRLNLQHVIGRLGRELGIAAEFVDFLGLSVWSEPMTVTMQDLLLEAFRSSEPTGDPSELRRVVLAPSVGEAELHTSPRAVIPLLVLLVRVVLDRHQGSMPHISLTPEVAGVSGVVISTAGGEGELRWVMARPIIPAAMECLHTAAVALDVKLQMSDSLDHIVAEFGVSSIDGPVL